MADKLAGEGELAQEQAVYEIEEKFGDAFVYDNQNGNRAISPAVLREFRKLTSDVVWDNSEKLWRQRYSWDNPDSRGQF